MKKSCSAKKLLTGMFVAVCGAISAMENTSSVHWSRCELSLRHRGLISDELDGILSALASEKRLELRVLDLRDNRLDTLPDSIVRLVNLEVLKLDANPLKIVPVVVFRLTHLKTLSLALCGLQTLPETVGQLVNLEVLDLSCNKRLTVLPDTLGDLVKLRELNLFADAYVKELSSSVYRLAPNLRKLNLLGTALNLNIRQLRVLHCYLPHTNIMDRFS